MRALQTLPSLVKRFVKKQETDEAVTHLEVQGPIWKRRETPPGDTMARLSLSHSLSTQTAGEEKNDRRTTDSHVSCRHLRVEIQTAHSRELWTSGRSSTSLQRSLKACLCSADPLQRGRSRKQHSAKLRRLFCDHVMMSVPTK